MDSTQGLISNNRIQKNSGCWIWDLLIKALLASICYSQGPCCELPYRELGMARSRARAPGHSQWGTKAIGQKPAGTWILPMATGMGLESALYAASCEMPAAFADTLMVFSQSPRATMIQESHYKVAGLQDNKCCIEPVSFWMSCYIEIGNTDKIKLTFCEDLFWLRFLYLKRFCFVFLLL